MYPSAWEVALHIDVLAGVVEDSALHRSALAPGIQLRVDLRDLAFDRSVRRDGVGAKIARPLADKILAVAPDCSAGNGKGRTRHQG